MLIICILSSTSSMTKIFRRFLYLVLILFLLIGLKYSTFIITVMMNPLLLLLSPNYEIHILKSLFICTMIGVNLHSIIIIIISLISLFQRDSTQEHAIYLHLYLLMILTIHTPMLLLTLPIMTMLHQIMTLITHTTRTLLFH